MIKPVLARPLWRLVAPALAGCLAAAAAQAEASRPGLEERVDALVGQLAACESGGHANPDHSGYLGRYQFSTGTVIAYVRERDGRAINAAEARAIARDDAQAGALARFMIFERNGYTHWPACSRKLGIPGKVAAFRRI